jgi:hypothetical protein
MSETEYLEERMKKREIAVTDAKYTMNIEVRYFDSHGGSSLGERVSGAAVLQVITTQLAFHCRPNSTFLYGPFLSYGTARQLIRHFGRFDSSAPPAADCRYKWSTSFGVACTHVGTYQHDGSLAIPCHG